MISAARADGEQWLVVGEPGTAMATAAIVLAPPRSARWCLLGRPMAYVLGGPSSASRAH